MGFHKPNLSLFPLEETMVPSLLLTLMQQIYYLSNFVIINLTTSLPSEARLPDPQILAHRLPEATFLSASLIRCSAL